MDIYVLNDNFERVGIIDSYTSLIWTTRYNTPGDFELYIAADADVIKLIRDNTYLVRDKDMNGTIYKNVMMIDKANIELKTDVENGDFLTVTGYSLQSILNRRIVINQTIMNGNLIDCVHRLIEENIITPIDSRRKIDKFVFETIEDWPEKLTMQVTGNNLGELLTEICQNYKVGYDIYIWDKMLMFKMYKGVDRSADQNENPRVIFSHEFDNLITSDYKEDVSAYANVAIVAGEGEGAARKKYETGDSTASGLNRFEIYVDARDLSTNEGEISASDYNVMLSEKGNEKLAELQTVSSFDGEIDATKNYVLNRDFYLGDIVQAINEYGISKSTRIVEIIDADDENGSSIIPTFSNF